MDGDARDGADAEAAQAATDGGERFYGRENFTIVLIHTGRQTGTTTTHVRDWGRRHTELNDTTVAVAGVTQNMRNRVIYEGPRVITIDSDTNAATATVNPLYDQVVASMRGALGRALTR